jgi:hypothetical protein
VSPRRRTRAKPLDAHGVPLTAAWPFLPEELVGALHLPVGYTADAAGLRQADGPLVTATPVLPAREILDIDQDTRLYEILTLERERYGRRVVAAKVLRDRRHVLALADFGLDVSSSSDRLLINFFRDYLRSNTLPRQDQTRRLGSRPTGSGPVYLLDEPVPSGNPLHFHAETPEAQRLQDALGPEGSVAGWAAAFRALLGHPTVVLTCLAAVVPPLVEVLGWPVASFWLHLVAPSSTGKTVTQRIALSVWANPWADGWLPSGHGTYAGIEALCLRVHGLPVFLQDVQLIRDQDRQALIYAVGNESFKARGGERRRTQATWRGVVISSGELPLVHEGSLAGEGARVLTCAGPPFGSQSAEIRRLLDDEIIPALRHHHAVVGRALVEHCHRLGSERQKAVRRQWEAHRQDFTLRAKGHPLLNRQAEQWAALASAAVILAEVLAIDSAPMTRAVEGLFEDARRASVPSLPRRAYQILCDEIFAQEASCYRWTGARYEPPSTRGRTIGVINEAEGFLAIYTAEAQMILRRHQLGEPLMVLAAMRDSELLKADAEHLTARVKIGDRRVRMYRLPWQQEEGAE